MSTHIPTLRQTLRFSRFLLLLVIALCMSRAARAHGGEDHGDEEKPAATTTDATTTAKATSAVTTIGSMAQTELELRLSDLSQSAAGVEAPLENATIRGFLKRADSEKILQRISARAEKTPGVYSIYFEKDQTSFAFPGAGRYLLELTIRPANGELTSATVAFALSPPAPAIAPIPLWRRARPLMTGALALLVLFALVRIVSARRKTPPGAPDVKSRAPDVSAALLLLALLPMAASTRYARAHGGEDHGDEEPAATVPSNKAPSGLAQSDEAPSSIRSGETTTTSRAGNFRITLTTRTRAAAPQLLAPGEVTLPPQTARLLQIKTQMVQVSRLASGITFSGQIAPNPNGVARVASVVPGRVTRLLAAQGDRVRQGQTVAIVESRAIGEAQSAFQQAQARLDNAQSNLDVVQQQARAGVFSRAPLDIARKAQAEAAGDARQQGAIVGQAQVALDNAARLARVGGYANPALETARSAQAQAREDLKTAQAALTNAQASIASARAELARRQQGAKAGLYASRPAQEAQRALVASQAARAQSQSEVATTRANLNRARLLAAEGLVSRRDLEAAQQAFDTATARLETAQADERAAQQEWNRQTLLASTNVAGIAEVQQARALLASSQADARTRQAQAQRARTQLELSGSALSRERAIFAGNIANRREIGTARANLQAAQAGLYKSRRALQIADATLRREQNVFRLNLNNTQQMQAARAAYVQARADLSATQNALSLLKSAPGEGVSVPIEAPLSGVVQTRDVAVGELVQADAPLFTIVNLDSLALEAALFESDFNQVRIGSPVSVATDAMPGKRFSGRISFLGSQVDPQTRTITARAIIANAGGLRPGMFARGQIQTGMGALSITVPASSVLDDGAARIVFVALGAKYERREITTGTASNGRVEIKTGLKQGEEIVSEGASALRAQAARGT